MNDHPNQGRPLREGLLRGLQTAAALGAAAILALVLYTSIVVQSSRRAQQAAATATVAVRSTAVYATVVAWETTRVEEMVNRPAQPVALPSAALTVENAGQLQELARWGQSGPCAEAWSPDGLYLAVQGSAGVHLYDTLTWKERTYLEAPSSWCGLAFSPDGQSLAILSRDVVRVWRWASGTSPQTLGEFPGPVYAATFASDGTLQVLGQASNTPAVWLWRNGKGALFFLPEEAADVVELFPVALSPDGRLLAAGSSDGTLRLWHTADGLPLPAAGEPPPSSGGWPLRFWREDTAPIVQLTFSPDSTLLVSLSSVPRIWQAADATLLQVLQGRPLAAALSSDGARLLVATAEGTVEAWQVEGGVRLWTSPQYTLWGEMALSPDGRLLAGGLGTGWAVWDVSSWRRIADDSWWEGVNPWCGVNVSPDGQYVATSGASEGGVWLWRLADSTLVRVLSASSDPMLASAMRPVCAITFSPDGTLLAGGIFSSTVVLWQVPAGTPARLLSGPLSDGDPWVSAVAFAPHGQFLAAGTADGTFLLWRVVDGALVHVLDEYVNPFVAFTYQVAFSPDGQFLVTLTDGGDLRLWRASDGAFQRTLEVKSWARAIAFSADGTTITSVGDDLAVRRRLLADGRLLEQRSATKDRGTDFSVALSPDGALLASGCLDGSLWLWDVASGEPLKAVRGHSDVVDSLAFTADGRLLISASRDGTIRVWGVR